MTNPPALPGTLPAALRAEFRRALHPPYEVPSVVFGNGLVMTACWTLLPTQLVDAIFTFHGSLAFTMVLASWMYSDVPATNVLGADARRARAALPDPAMLRRLLYAKNLVLWLLITPLCTVAAIVVGVNDHRLTTTLLTVVWIAVVPLGALGTSAWLGIRWPYHPLPVRYRWANRRRWRPLLGRWALLLIAPYLLVPLLTAVLTLPSLLLWHAVAPSDTAARLTDAEFAWGLLLAAVIAIPAWIAGHHAGTRLAHRRGSRLADYLADPERG